MKFIIDQQLPPTLLRWLVARGHAAEHVRNVGLRDADDRDIWLWAEREGAAIITKDEDFAILRGKTHDGPIIVWLRIGNATTAVLLAWLDDAWADVEAALSTGAPVIEVR